MGIDGLIIDNVFICNTNRMDTSYESVMKSSFLIQTPNLFLVAYLLEISLFVKDHWKEIITVYL